MARKTPLSVRVSADVKDAVVRAAAADDRSTSWIAEQALAEWLKARGFLAASPPKRRPTTAR
jgi:predicted transcriptional regulator